MKVDVIIPAYNEEKSIDEVLNIFSDLEAINRIIVVNNASNDNTADIACKYTTHVLYEDRIGKGFALLKGLEYANTEFIMVCDADISGLSHAHIKKLIYQSEKSSYCLNRFSIKRDIESAPVTALVANPLISVCYPSLPVVDEPLGGIFLIKREFALRTKFPTDWGVDVFFTLRALNARSYHEEVITGVSHRKKSLGDYIEMSRDVIKAILSVEIEN